MIAVKGDKGIDTRRNVMGMSRKPRESHAKN